MHPAYSVIVFTTCSGMGYGLLILLAVLGPFRFIPETPLFGAVGCGLALALVTVGLLSSALHLGRPERAWRAMSQWRSSWLSREGVFALVTYVPAVLLAAVWVLGDVATGVGRILALLTIAGAVATLWCTGMIYASLPTIRAWHQPLVAPIYVALGLATGAVLVNLLIAVSGYESRVTVWLALTFLSIAWVLKALYWSKIDREKRTHTIEGATGLGRFGNVRSFELPHTQANFVMREMGYHVGRKHRTKLRRIATALLFLLPIGCVVLMLLTGPAPSLILAAVALASASAGVLIERWLFFAEAEHVVMLYYGAQAA